MSSAVTTDLDIVLTEVSKDHPEFDFVEAAEFSWHGGKRHISYKKDIDHNPYAISSLLHELGHALSAHKDYVHDIELLQMEVAAWDKARELAKRYSHELSEDHIQDCLDTYRDWLHLRATCPTCYSRALQSSRMQYRCFNCQSTWQVSRSRLCRPYRLQTA